MAGSAAPLPDGGGGMSGRVCGSAVGFPNSVPSRASDIGFLSTFFGGRLGASMVVERAGRGGGGGSEPSFDGSHGTRCIPFEPGLGGVSGGTPSSTLARGGRWYRGGGGRMTGVGAEAVC